MIDISEPRSMSIKRPVQPQVIASNRLVMVVNTFRFIGACTMHREVYLPRMVYEARQKWQRNRTAPVSMRDE